MRTLAAALLLSSPALSQAKPAAPVDAYWTKSYVVPHCRETWTAELIVKDLDAGVDATVKAIETEKGRLTAGLANFVGSQSSKQLSFSIPVGKADALVKKLKKIGAMAEPAKHPYFPPFPKDELRSKIMQLERERKDAAEALAKAPVAAQLLNETLGQLRGVEAASIEADKLIRFNLTLKKN